MAELSKTELGKQLRIWPAVFRTEFGWTAFRPELEFRLWPNLANIDGWCPKILVCPTFGEALLGPPPDCPKFRADAPCPPQIFIVVFYRGIRPRWTDMDHPKNTRLASWYRCVNPFAGTRPK